MKNLYYLLMISTDLEKAVDLHQRGHLDAATAKYLSVLKKDPKNSNAINNLGAIYFETANLKLALDFFSQAVNLSPRDLGALYNLGRVFQEMEKWDEAIAAYKKALRIDRKNVATLENLYEAFAVIGNDNAKLKTAQTLVGLKRESKNFLALARAQKDTANYSEAQKNIAEAIKIDGPRPNSLYSLAEIQLRKGDLANGWHNYAHRWNDSSFKNANKELEPPPLMAWTGQSLKNRTLLIKAEQGLGDEILFANTFDYFASLGGKVHVECDPRLTSIFKRSFPSIQFLNREDNRLNNTSQIQIFDYFVWSGDLNSACRLDESHFPRAPWLKGSGTSLTGKLAKRSNSIDLLRIGVSWRGGFTLSQKAKRSIPLTELLGVFDPGLHQIFSLQYDATPQEIEASKINSQQSLITDPDFDYQNDMEGLANLILSLDLVLTIDNSIAHLAGALGVPCWVLLQDAANWRWLNERSKVAWYPKTKLYRNKDHRKWHKSLTLIQQDLLTLEKRSESQTHVNIERSNTPSLSPLEQPIARVAKRKKRILLLNDTLNWYHFGCTMTSLAIYEELSLRGFTIDSFSALEITSLKSYPTTPGDFDSQGLLDRLTIEAPHLISKLQSADIILVNGEGSLHGKTEQALKLLYLMYISKEALKKKVQIINHSVFPQTPEDTDSEKLYLKVYSKLDFVAVRDSESKAICEAMNIDAELAFDCLPRLINKYFSKQPPNKERVITLAGTALGPEPFKDNIFSVVKAAKKYDLKIQFLYGARLNIAKDDLETVALLTKYFRSEVEINLCSNESEWLNRLSLSNFLIGGRFHYAIAASCMQIPTLMTSSNTPKNRAIHTQLGAIHCETATFDQVLEFIENSSRDSLAPGSYKLAPRLSALAARNFKAL